MQKSWTDEQIYQHQKAADLCCQVMDECFKLMKLKNGIGEHEVQQFILDRFSENDLVMDGDMPIVAFRENTSFVHYYPEEATAKVLEPNSLIMIDLWARLDESNAPYADITWMAWYGGEVPAEIQAGFDNVIQSRDKGLDFIQAKLSANQPIKNSELGEATEKVTLSSHLQDLVPHAYGHSLGTTSCHGNLGVIHSKSTTSIIDKVGYTIEPGIYIDGKYGFRSEIDFYTDSDKIVVTTKIQKELVRI